MLDVVELTEQVARRAPRQSRHRAKAFQIGAVTDPARNRLAGLAGHHQRLPLRKAAGWGIGDEPRAGITQLRKRHVLRRLDYAVPDWLAVTASVRNQHKAEDAGFRHRCGFYHPD